jgi:hypothetical protein
LFFIRGLLALDVISLPRGPARAMLNLTHDLRGNPVGFRLAGVICRANRQAGLNRGSSRPGVLRQQTLDGAVADVLLKGQQGAGLEGLRPRSGAGPLKTDSRPG